MISFYNSTTPSPVSTAPDGQPGQQGMHSRKLRIVFLHSGSIKNENYGNFLQRVWKPCSLWQNDPLIAVTELSVHAPEAFELSLACDLLVVIQCDIHWLWHVIQHRKKAKLATLFEINDDIASLGDWLPVTHPLKSPLSRQHLLNLAHCSDAVLFSSQELANYYQALHPLRLVTDPWVESPRTAPLKQEGFVIGWGGSTSHLDDLLWIAPALARFLVSHPDARLSIMGCNSKLSKFLSALPSAQVTHIPFGDESGYFTFLQSLHVGIAPLKDTRFNHCRSDGKFIQYAINGCASLLSNLPPFQAHHERAILFDSPEEMYEGLERLYRDRSALSSLADMAYQWAQEHRSPLAVKEHLKSIFSMFLPQQPQSCHDKATFWSEERRQIWWAIQQAMRDQNHEQSIRLCHTLLNEHADLPQVRWLLIHSLLATGQREEALEATQAPTRSTIWADEFSTVAHSIVPPSDSQRKTSLLKNLHHPLKRLQLKGLPVDDLENHFRLVLDWLPYDYFSLFGLMQILEKRHPESKELNTLRTRAQLLTPENPQQR
jgi:hypothetical protein